MGILMELGFDNSAVKLWLRFEASRHRCTLRCGPYAWDLTKDTRVIRIAPRQFAGVGFLATQFDALFETLEAGAMGHQMLLHLHKFRGSGLTFELGQWPQLDASIDDYIEWYQPRASDLVFDLGAEYGIATYDLAKLAGRVVAFEPEPRTRVILERNVNRLGLKNVAVAKDSIASFAELVELYGPPAFCKVNLDEVAPDFLSIEANAWTSHPIVFAAHSQSAGVRKRFAAFLLASGFETTSERSLGLVWARPGTD
jgi:predicted RNA methylase